MIAGKDLTWSFDGQPGIRRRPRGKGFSYLTPDGTPVRDAETVERIRTLAIPPAWKDVWISPLETGHIQATGRDARGRKQYIYHPAWRAARDATKYHRMLDFGRALATIRAQVDRDLSDRELSRERVVAGVVRLLDVTAIRIGNESYAKENGSYGLTTLRNNHATVLGTSVKLEFNGKGGKKYSTQVQDRKLARTVRACEELPGQELFQYIGDDGERHRVRSDDVNDYLRRVTGGEFSAKDFRTWSASVLAARLLADREPATSKAAALRHENEVTSQVANVLGNTRTICRQCYVYPGIYEAYRDGTLQQGWLRNRRRWSSQSDRPEENLLLWLLRNQQDEEPVALIPAVLKEAALSA